MSSLLRYKNAKTEDSVKSTSFGIETINAFIHVRSFLENHTLVKTKIDKVYTRFLTKTAQKPYPWGGGAHTYMAYIRD